MKRAIALIVMPIFLIALGGCDILKFNKEDVLLMMSSKGTIHSITNNKPSCNIVIKTDNGLTIAIIKRNFSACKEFKKGDKVIFNFTLQPSRLAKGDIEKL